MQRAWKSGGVNGEDARMIGLVDVECGAISLTLLQDTLQQHKHLHFLSLKVECNSSDDNFQSIDAIAKSSVRRLHLYSVYPQMIPHLSQLHDLEQLSLSFANVYAPEIDTALLTSIARRNSHMQCLHLTNMRSMPKNIPALVARFPRLQEFTLSMYSSKLSSPEREVTIELLTQMVRVMCPRMLKLNLQL
jgi:hypothetical protein